MGMTPTVPDLRLHSHDSPFVENWVLARETHEAAKSFIDSVPYNLDCPK